MKKPMSLLKCTIAIALDNLLSSELFNSKERVTMYFPMRIGPFSNKIAIVHFSTEGVKKKPMRDLALVFS